MFSSRRFGRGATTVAINWLIALPFGLVMFGVGLLFVTRGWDFLMAASSGSRSGALFLLASNVLITYIGARLLYATIRHMVRAVRTFFS